ncbi:phage head closure protein [Cohnella abietis]|uniref:Phage head-tail adapter protein n=1 Tax=Cohnella abietis TaxID=2507935 RepID=A0A3T1D2Z5_9BACL|nr:phage head closure protein [Cohnella abietis]BBI32483.1 hypothetical protein KCTCHS21_18820 [Cohnella abietis]
MLWNDEVDLIHVTHSNDSTVVVSETVKTVFANKKSVTRSEFYQGVANNLKPVAVFEVNSFEYEDEQKLRHEGSDYMIIRSYQITQDLLELTCQAYSDVETNLARLRDMVEVWHNTFKDNSMGEKSPFAELLYTLPAQIEYKGGGASELDGVIETTNTATITIQYREGVSSNMWIVIDGRRYDINHIEDPYNRHETLVLYVERVTP